MQKRYSFGVLMVLLGSICFSTKAIFVKLGLREGIDSITLLMLRMLFAFPVYVFYAFYLYKKGKFKVLNKRDYLSILLLGVLGYYLASLFDFLGLAYINASLERLILFVYPTFVLIMGKLFFQRKINKLQWIAVAITYAGMLFAFITDMKLDYNNGMILGIVLILLSAITYAYYLVSSDQLIAKIGSSTFTTLSMLVSSFAVLLHFTIQKPIDLLNYDTKIYALGMALGWIATVLPTFMISAGIKHIGSSNASLLASVGPVSTITLATIFLDEHITFYHIIGTFLVLIGVSLISIYGGKK